MKSYTTVQLFVAFSIVFSLMQGYESCKHGTFYDYGKDAEICCDFACELDPNTGNVNMRCKVNCPDYAEILVQCGPDEAYINKEVQEKNCISCSEVCRKYSKTVCESKCKGYKNDGCKALMYYDVAIEDCKTCTCTSEESCQSNNCMDFWSLCHPNPCGNGTCNVDFGTQSYVCECPSGWKGENCSQEEVFYPKCESSCENGNCTFDPISGEVICKCNPGWKGDTCSAYKKTCSSKPCFNGGICKQNEDGIECICLTPYIGEYCEANGYFWFGFILIFLVIVIAVLIFALCFVCKRRERRNHNVYKNDVFIGKGGEIEAKALVGNGDSSAGTSTITVNRFSQYSRHSTLDEINPGNASQESSTILNSQQSNGEDRNQIEERQNLLGFRGPANTNASEGRTQADIGTNLSQNVEPSIDPETGCSAKVNQEPTKTRRPKEESGDPYSKYTLEPYTSV